VRWDTVDGGHTCLLRHKQRREASWSELCQIEVDEDLKGEFSTIAAGIWAALDKLTNIGGAIRMVSAIFENFKVLGLPVKGTNTAILVTVDVKLDSYVLAERVNEFVSYWLKVNHYIK
jgi:hypothetical protein